MEEVQPIWQDGVVSNEKHDSVPHSLSPVHGPIQQHIDVETDQNASSSGFYLTSMHTRWVLVVDIMQNQLILILTVLKACPSSNQRILITQVAARKFSRETSQVLNNKSTLRLSKKKRDAIKSQKEERKE